MDWSATFSLFAALRGLRGPRSGDADRADMGTAFGLDASFDSFAAPSLPAAEQDRPTPVALPWESRLVRRSGL